MSSPAWSCAVCTVVHEGAKAEYLSCGTCGADRPPTIVAAATTGAAWAPGPGMVAPGGGVPVDMSQSTAHGLLAFKHLEDAGDISESMMFEVNQMDEASTKAREAAEKAQRDADAAAKAQRDADAARDAELEAARALQQEAEAAERANADAELLRAAAVQAAEDAADAERARLAAARAQQRLDAAQVMINEALTANAAAGKAAEDAADAERARLAADRERTNVPGPVAATTAAAPPSIMASMLHMSAVGEIPADLKTGAGTVTVRSQTTASPPEALPRVASSASSDDGVMPLSDGNLEFGVAATSVGATVTVSAASLVPVNPEDAAVSVWYYKEGAITNMLSGWCKDAVQDPEDGLVWTISGLVPATNYVFKVMAADIGEREQKVTTPTGIPQFTVAPSSAKTAFVTLAAGTETPEDLVIECRTHAGLLNPSPRWVEAAGGRDGDDRMKHHVIGLKAATGYVFRVTRPNYPRGAEASIVTLPEESAPGCGVEPDGADSGSAASA